MTYVRRKPSDVCLIRSDESDSTMEELDQWCGHFTFSAEAQLANLPLQSYVGSLLLCVPA